MNGRQFWLLIGIYKESVELTFVYLIEGCGKTLAKKTTQYPTP